MNGEIVGSIFVVEGNEDTAKLRLLIVDTKARGLGLGSQLVEECINFLDGLDIRNSSYGRIVSLKKLVIFIRKRALNL
ncbi:GNAT family N-acetyltransferase [Neobacillus niacini]|uniref:GNAT family N-acetyltransferase n=1 Tax=Neobacillus niacini TaxID=86668 RepID=UPI002FFFCA6F